MDQLSLEERAQLSPEERARYEAEWQRPPVRKDVDLTIQAGHKYTGYETRDTKEPDIFGDKEWRWVCSCGQKGHWQSQSPSCCSYSHRRHKWKFPIARKG